MAKSNLEVKNTFTLAKQQIEERNYAFFMRNAEQQEYHPKNIKSFTEERYRIAYVLQDMASLVTSNEISHFLLEIAFNLRNDKHNRISREELDLVKKFIAEGGKEYRESKYVNLENVTKNDSEDQ